MAERLIWVAILVLIAAACIWGYRHDRAVIEGCEARGGEYVGGRHGACVDRDAIL